MVDGFDADDFGFEFVVLLAEEAQEFQFRARRPDEQNLACP